ncbi:hypothetical protein MNBD_BACTEROID05-219, partial [hydrothermal vent metagenome]
MGRMEKVNQQLKREIGNVLQREFGDPKLTLISITHVETSKDLRNARVSFSVMGEDSDVEHAKESLAKVKGLIRKYVGKKMVLRNIPELNFVYDDSIKSSIRIENM